MSIKQATYLAATTLFLTACGSGGSSEAPTGTATAGNSIAILTAALTNGNTLQDSSSLWRCDSTSSALTVDGINQNEFRFFSDFSGRQGDTDVGADQGISWTAIGGNSVQITFTDTDPSTSSLFQSISLNANNTQFSASVEEIVGINLPRADYTCSRIENAEDVFTPSAPVSPDSQAQTLRQRLVSTDTSTVEWACTYSDVSNSFTYRFNADNTGTDLISTESTPTEIEFVITEPGSIRANFANGSFASLLWNRIEFQNDFTFTAIDGLSISNDGTVSCAAQIPGVPAPTAPPSPEPITPASAVCPCQISSITDFLNANASSTTFVISQSIAGGQMAEIDLDGDSLIDMGIIVRDVGIRDCSFSPFSDEFGVANPGPISLTSVQATACLNDLNELLNTEL